jgi:diketogulonate reductase-like aldo/keto reductase
VRRKSLGWTGEPLPLLGQGTWRMENDDRDQCIRTLRRGLDAGLSHIDTAELYGDGYVESAIVAEAIAGRRDEVFLTSKVMPHHASYVGTIAACERSLERLRTDRLDLYLLHWRGPHPLTHTISAFERLVEDGKIRYFGVSNFDAHEVEEVARIAGPARLAANQVLYHLEERAIEDAVIPACERHRMAVLAYSPFGHGQLPAPQSWAGSVLAEIAHAHAATAPAVALAFLVRRHSVFALPKTADADHLVANAAAGELQLSEQELARIDAAFPAGPPPRELPML